MSIVAIIQARFGSTRLPGKIFLPLCGKPMLWHIVNRVKAARLVDKVVIATTDNQLDDAVELWCKQENIPCFRGSETNVLARYVGAAEHFNADIIVRITADDPFKDPEIIDTVIEHYLREKLEFGYNNRPPTFPEGLDVEVFSLSAIQEALRNATEPFDLEHVTPYLASRPGVFKQSNLPNSHDLSHLRWTVDTKIDLELAEEFYSYLYNKKQIFLMNDMLALSEALPHLNSKNAGVKRSALYERRNPSDK